MERQDPLALSTPGTRKMSKFASLLALLAVVPSLASAQSAIYGQCGGIGWSKSSIKWLDDAS